MRGKAERIFTKALELNSKPVPTTVDSDVNDSHYFFRDIRHDDNVLDGKSFHAAGVVSKIYCDLNTGNPSGKDLSVTYIEPFSGNVAHEWRALDEVELFEVEREEYTKLHTRLLEILQRRKLV